jgi:hypothetical protein
LLWQGSNSLRVKNQKVSFLDFLIFNKKETFPESFSEPISPDFLKLLETFDFNPRKVSCDFILLLGLILYPALFKSILTTNEQYKQNPNHSSFSEFQKKKWNDLFQHELIFTSCQTEDIEYSFLNIQDGSDREAINKIHTIFPERNKLFWKHSSINLWMKRVCGFLVEMVDNKHFDIVKFRNNLNKPEDIDFEENLVKYSLPFEPSIHRGLLTGNFTDQEERINFGDIDEQDREQMRNMANVDVS